MLVTLIRKKSDTQTNGTMVFFNQNAETAMECATLELPWKDNIHEISCIPEGTYKVVRHQSPTLGDCFEILDVPKRDEVLIHIGNTTKDTHGCILVGFPTKSPTMISNSKVTLDKIKKYFPNGFTLHILAVN